MKKMKWNEILSDDCNRIATYQFANNNLSGHEFVRRVPGTSKFVRNRGVQEARRIARKALRRRGYEISNQIISC